MSTLTQPKIRVFLLDDHELVRRGVAGMLEAAGDIEIIGEAGTAAQAVARIAATKPDVALLDMRLPDGTGVDVCRDVMSKNPAVRCIILTAYDDDEALYSAVVAGASGYVLKDIRGNGLIEAVRKVAAGKSLLDASLSRLMVEKIQQDQFEQPQLASLSVRERDILVLIADGMTNRQIGETLSLAEKTVKNYVSSLLSKLGLQRRTQAVALQIESRSQPHG